MTKKELRKRRFQGREDYLRILFQLHHENKKIKSVDLAKQLKISKPSVSEMLSKLKSQGLIEMEKYSKIKLTKKGINLGEKYHDTHHSLRRFLKLIGHDELNAREQACILEHHVHNDTLKLINNVVNKGEISEIPVYVG